MIIIPPIIPPNNNLDERSQKFLRSYLLALFMFFIISMIVISAQFIFPWESEFDITNSTIRKVSEIHDVKVPIGVRAVYNSLEKTYQFNIANKVADKKLDILFTIDNQTNLTYIVLTKYHDNNKIMDLYINNSSDIIKYSYYISSVNRYMSCYPTVEFIKMRYSEKQLNKRVSLLEGDSQELLFFLVGNLSNNSQLTLNFMKDANGQGKSTVELSQAEYQQLYSLLSFYQELSTTIPKKYNNVDIPLYINVLTDTTTRKTVITSRDITREYSSSDKDKFSYLEIINDNNKISPVMTFYFGFQSLKKLKLIVNNANNISEYMIHDYKGDFNERLELRDEGKQTPVNEGVIDFINSNIKNDSLVYYEFIDYNDEGETIYVNPSQIKNMREISQIYRQLSPK